MIISDLNYLEAVSAETEIVGGTSNRNFDFKKNLKANIDVDVKNNFKTDVDIKFNKNAKLKAEADVKGNLANIVFDNEAVGKNTDTEGKIDQFVYEGELSSQAGYFTAAANG